ncbi:hypothetical protein TRVL_09663 [Trypanosoma vivax]|nr:hypothetical protein TRVL_09663 [Trypanosoma vivax]
MAFTIEQPSSALAQSRVIPRRYGAEGSCGPTGLTLTSFTASQATNQPHTVCPSRSYFSWRPSFSASVAVSSATRTGRAQHRRRKYTESAHRLVNHLAAEHPRTSLKNIVSRHRSPRTPQHRKTARLTAASAPATRLINRRPPTERQHSSSTTIPPLDSTSPHTSLQNSPNTKCMAATPMSFGPHAPTLIHTLLVCLTNQAQTTAPKQHVQ